ncbi:MAG: hypothetical protein O3B87_02915 [bacterium]|nr:hypothetical protein [bacterium]
MLTPYSVNNFLRTHVALIVISISALLIAYFVDQYYILGMGWGFLL